MSRILSFYVGEVLEGGKILITESNIRAKRHFPLVFLFFAVLVAGLFYVKWNPYYHKAFLAAAKHSLGASLISGNSAVPPAPSWSAALNYFIDYFKAIWQAVILWLLLGSMVQVLIPRDWILRVLGRNNFNSTIMAGLIAVPSMMCSCCAAPLAVGLRKQSANIGATLAYWLGNPILNPATIIFTGFVLSWKFSLLRIIIGLILVFGVSFLVNKFVKEDHIPTELYNIIEEQPIDENLFSRWLKCFWSLTLDSVPAYLIMVLVLGAVRAWLFPAINPAWSDSILIIIGFAIAGTLFMVPTAAEIPVVKTLMHFGLGLGPATALFITLPAVNLASLLMVRRSFPTRILILVFGSVVVIGVLSGVLAGIIL